MNPFPLDDVLDIVLKASALLAAAGLLDLTLRSRGSAPSIAMTAAGFG